MHFAVYGTCTFGTQTFLISKLGGWKHTTAFHKLSKKKDSRCSNTLGNTEARIIGVMRLANKKIKYEILSIIGIFGANARSADRTFAPKREPRFKRIWARLLRPVLCADWLAFVWPLNEDEGQPYFKTKCLIFMKNRCTGVIIYSDILK